MGVVAYKNKNGSRLKREKNPSNRGKKDFGNFMGKEGKKRI